VSALLNLARADIIADPARQALSQVLAALLPGTMQPSAPHRSRG
jgi:hypothetical protein